MQHNKCERSPEIPCINEHGVLFLVLDVRTLSFAYFAITHRFFQADIGDGILVQRSGSKITLMLRRSAFQRDHSTAQCCTSLSTDNAAIGHPRHLRTNGPPEIPCKTCLKQPSRHLSIPHKTAGSRDCFRTDNSRIAQNGMIHPFHSLWPYRPIPYLSSRGIFLHRNLQRRIRCSLKHCYRLHGFLASQLKKIGNKCNGRRGRSRVIATFRISAVHSWAALVR